VVAGFISLKRVGELGGRGSRPVGGGEVFLHQGRFFIILFIIKGSGWWPSISCIEEEGWEVEHFKIFIRWW
jgi:hypothetical protein